MYIQAVPFRTYLNDPAPRGPEEGRAHRRVMEAALDADHQSPQERLRVAKSPWETAHWMLVKQLGSLSRSLGKEQEEERALRLLLIQQSVERAQEEGVAWTPLIDELVASGIWARAGRESSAEETVPSLEPLLKRIGTWVEGQSEAQALEWLREFRAPEIAQVLGAHTRLLDSDSVAEMMDWDLRSGLGLARNPALTPELRGEVAGWAWEHLARIEGSRRNSYSSYSGPDHSREALEIVQEVAGHTEGTPAAFLEEFLEAQEARAPMNRSHLMLRALLRDRTLSEENFRRIAGLIRGGPAVGLVMDSRATPEIWKQMTGEDPELVKMLLRAEGVPEALLEVVLRSGVSLEEGQIQEVLRQSHCPLWFARQQLQEWPGHRGSQYRLSMARNRRLREDPEIFQGLKEARDPAVLQVLILQSHPSVVPALFREFAALSAKPAIDLLMSDQISREVALTQQDLLPLLEHPTLEIRVAAMTAVSHRFGNQGPETEPRQQEEVEHLPQGRSR